MSLFPIFLKLEGRRSVVIGAGQAGTQKIAGLLEAGAEVTVIDPSPSLSVRELAWARQLVWHARKFQSRDLDSAYLVIAATSDADANQRICEEARTRGILTNVVDVPPQCDFYYPAVA